MSTIALPEPRIIEGRDIYVSLQEFKGRTGIDIRHYFEGDAPDYAMKPGKGIRVPVKYFDELIQHLTALRADALALGLIEGPS